MAFSSLILRQLLSEAEQNGIACERLVTGILEPSRLATDFWVDDRDMFQIVARTQLASDAPGIGLRLGARGRLTALGPVGMLLTVAETFRQVMHGLARFSRVVRDTEGVFVCETGSALTMEFAVLNGPLGFQECITEFIASSLAALFARFAGPCARFSRLLLNYPAPAHVAAYERMFGCELRFNQPRCGIVVDAAMADRVQPLAQPELAQQLWRMSERQVARFSGAPSIVDEVRAGLRVDWGSPPPLLEALARRLGMSGRSLRRRLAEMNVDYRTLVDERRRELALQMRAQRSVSSKEVAHGLGYSNPSAFHRAYKRWMATGSRAPGQSTDALCSSAAQFTTTFNGQASALTTATAIKKRPSRATA